MKEDTLYNILIAISIIGIIVILVLIFTTKTTESFTELYFEDHQNLPNEIELNQEYTFQFTIHNLENEATTYNYKVYLLIDDQTQSIDSKSITLNNNETATITESFEISQDFNSAKIVVDTNDQEIHFWVKQ